MPLIEQCGKDVVGAVIDMGVRMQHIEDAGVFVLTQRIGLGATSASSALIPGNRLVIEARTGKTEQLRCPTDADDLSKLADSISRDCVHDACPEMFSSSAETFFWTSITKFARTSSSSSLATRAASSAFLRRTGSVGLRRAVDATPPWIAWRHWDIDEE